MSPPRCAPCACPWPRPSCLDNRNRALRAQLVNVSVIRKLVHLHVTASLKLDRNSRTRHARLDSYSTGYEDSSTLRLDSTNLDTRQTFRQTSTEPPLTPHDPGRPSRCQARHTTARHLDSSRQTSTDLDRPRPTRSKTGIYTCSRDQVGVHGKDGQPRYSPPGISSDRLSPSRTIKHGKPTSGPRRPSPRSRS